MTMKALGIDPGDARIGLAISDDLSMLAHPLETIELKKTPKPAERIAALVAERGIGIIILGLPRNMDGSEGAQASAARSFGAELSAIGLAVVFGDERLTSWQAGEQLATQGRLPSRASGERDSAAARLILQEYLDARAAPTRQQETR